MPVYNYKCLKCNKVKDVIHNYSELTKPSIETIEEITCCNKLMVEGYWDKRSNGIVTNDTKNIIARGK